MHGSRRAVRLLGIEFHLLPCGSAAKDSDARWRSEFALRLSSDVGGVGAGAGGWLCSGLTRLMESPTLARAARFFVLSIDRQRQSQAGPAELYAGWEWK